MKSSLPLLIVLLGGLIGSIENVAAHPGSGIVVASDGQVYFQDALARTIWKIDTNNNVSAHDDKMGGHWMELDQEGRFASPDKKLVERIPIARGPAQLIVAEGGAPIALGHDGILYYGLATTNAGDVAVGLSKISPGGKRESFAPPLSAMIADLGITGITSAPDGSLYLACLTAILRVTPDGSISTILNPVVLENGNPIERTVFLRGLAADSDGIVYVAASGSRSVIRIGLDRKAVIMMTAEAPWTPTGVALHRGDLYVLEYTNAERNAAEGWLPRVRKRSSDGTVTTLATITADQQNRQPNRIKLP